jgi:CheY-like chemotaxis protein
MAPRVLLVEDEAIIAHNLAGRLRELGYDVVAIVGSAEGGLIDMRFRVADAQKAALLLDEASRPRLVAEDSGAVLTMHVRPDVDSYEAGRVYYLLYANSRNAIVPGSLVTVELGDLQLQHLVAQ